MLLCSSSYVPPAPVPKIRAYFSLPHFHLVVFSYTHLYPVFPFTRHFSLFRLHMIRDNSKEKPLELEMGWLCAETQFKHALVPSELVAAADAAGKAALEGSASSAASEEKAMEVTE
mmetsp:Transcript_23039/g.49868  ORF Transcript_23039/g.49868 Transcript_23039/m.49868 type:complete len:116 (-) Transcript_23039:79-426(-)